MAFVFGQKAFDKVLDSEFRESINNELSEVRVYAEGRGIRIEVKSKEIFPDIKTLI